MACVIHSPGNGRYCGACRFRPHYFQRSGNANIVGVTDADSVSIVCSLSCGCDRRRASRRALAAPHFGFTPHVVVVAAPGLGRTGSAAPDRFPGNEGRPRPPTSPWHVQRSEREHSAFHRRICRARAMPGDPNRIAINGLAWPASSAHRSTAGISACPFRPSAPFRP